MSRWLQSLIWAAGSCAVWCPVCVCLNGNGAWWVCASTFGLLSITVVSGYTTWTVIHNILNNEATLNRFLSEYLSFFTVQHRLRDEAFNKGFRLYDSSILEQEISSSAHTFYIHLILPWYSHISPDEKYALQMRSTLEDLLMGISKNVQQHSNFTIFLQDIVRLYIQHYRQFYKALKKVSQKLNRRPVCCTEEISEIKSFYKPLHPALKTSDGINMHLQRLVHFLLVSYLPSEVSRCSLLFVSLRDLFAQNLLHSVLDIVCDIQWLNKTLISYMTCHPVSSEVCPAESLSKHSQSLLYNLQNTLPTRVDTEKEDKIFSYSHILAAIREETSFEVSDMENLNIDAKVDRVTLQNVKRLSSLTSANSVSFSKELDDIQEVNSEPLIAEDTQDNSSIDNRTICNSTELKLREIGDVKQRFENTEALIKYVMCPPLESCDTKSDDKEKSLMSALGGFISTTAVPLLPDSTSFPTLGFQRKMWQSPMEEKDILMEVVPKIKTNPFKRHIVEGIKEDDYSRFLKNYKELSLAELKQKLKQPNNVKEIFQLKSSSHMQNDDELKELQRSKSLTNLNFRSVSNSTDDIASSSRFSFSSESIGSVHFVEDFNEQMDGEFVSRRDKKLRKMHSFDKNDGTDAFSLHSSALFYGEGTAVLSNDDTVDQSDNCKCHLDQHDNCKCHLDQPDNCKCHLPLTSDENTVELPRVGGTSSLHSTPSSSSTLALEATCGRDLVSGEMTFPCAVDSSLSPDDDESPDFGWENTDLSPIYEESENLASTIAKLRCLLSERQSQHSLGSQSSFGSSESEPKSAQSDPGRYNLEKSRFTFLHKDSSGSLASVKSTSSAESHCLLTTDEEILEASDVPLDGRVFTSICIPTTEVHTEASGFQYTLYIIQYDAIYLCETFSSSIDSTIGGVTEIPIQITEPKMVLQTNFVKRRFREFLSLHSALEDDPHLRLSMKGVKGPNKWLNLPFSKLDSATISSRKQFLEKYLQAIIQRTNLNTSLPLKEFLAYGSDGSIAFAKKPLELNVPRIDKLLARTVSGVFHSIKTALPTFDSADVAAQTVSSAVSSTIHQKSGSVHSTDAILKPVYERSRNSGLMISSRKDFEIQLDITAEEEICEMEGALLAAISSTSQLNTPEEIASEAQEDNVSPVSSSISFLPKPHQLNSHTSPLNPKNCFSLARPHSRTQSIKCYDQTDVSESSSQGFKELPPEKHVFIPASSEESLDDFSTEYDADMGEEFAVFSALVDAAVEVISSSDHPITRQSCTTLFTRLFARLSTNFIKEKMESLLSTEGLQQCFEQMRLFIVETQSAVVESHAVTENDTSSKEELINILFDKIPNSLKFILGDEVIRNSLTLFIESMQHSALNQDFCLHLIDLVFVHMLLPV